MDQRSAFRTLQPQLRAPEIALREAIHLYLACIHNDLGLAELNLPSRTGSEAIAEVKSCFEEMQQGRRIRGQPTDPREFFIHQAAQGRVPDFPLEGLGAEKVVCDFPEFGLGALLRREKQNNGSRAFESLKRWIELKKWGDAGQKEIIAAHHRGEVKLVGAPHVGARSSQRRSIPSSFSFEFPFGGQRVVYDGEVLLAPTTGPIPEEWLDVRIVGAGLLELINNKLTLDPPTHAVSQATDCRECLAKIMKESPDKRTHTIEDLWAIAKKLLPELDRETFDRQRKDLVKKGGQYESWRKGGAPRKK